MREWLKVPGLFYRHELEQVIELDGEHEYRFEATTQDEKGRTLVAIFCRPPSPPRCSAVLGVPRRDPDEPRPRSPGGMS